MAKYVDRATGERRVTVDGSRLDKKLKASKTHKRVRTFAEPNPDTFAPKRQAIPPRPKPEQAKAQAPRRVQE